MLALAEGFFVNLLICDVALSHRCIAASLTRGPIYRNGAKQHFVISSGTHDVAQPYREPLMPSETSRANGATSSVRLRHVGKMAS